MRARLLALGAVAAILAALGASCTTSEPNVTPTSSPGEDHVFVYGTLMPGHLRHPLIERYVAEATRDSVPGRLFDTGAGYPAAKFGPGDGVVEGYVLRLHPDEADRARRTLRQIEAGLYREVSVRTESGVVATAFEWIGSTDGMQPLQGLWRGP